MNKAEHQILDRLVDDFLNPVKVKYSEKYYHLQITESKSKSIYFVFRKKRGHLSEQEKKKLFEDIEDIINSIYKYFSYKSKFILRN